MEKRNPKKQMRNAMKPLGNFLIESNSDKTVEVASTMEKAESIPRKNNVELNRNVQKLAQSIKSQAVGKAMKANPAEEVFDLARLPWFSK